VLLLACFSLSLILFCSLYEQENAAILAQEQQADAAEDVELLMQREIDAVADKGAVSPLASLEADIQGTRAALLAALSESNDDQEYSSSDNE
jgi:hypothetical protein